MLWGMTEEQIATCFTGAPAFEAPWIGVPVEIAEEVEVLPVQFGFSRFLMFFANAVYEIGGDQELLHSMAASWTGGFQPDEHNRLVKFIRADAKDPELVFDPDQWKLGNPRQIFQFGELLVRAVLFHAELHADVTQYFFKPENERLKGFYRRAFSSFQSACPSMKFAPILSIDVDEGGFYGYQRKDN